MNSKHQMAKMWLITYSAIFGVLAVVVTIFKIQLPFGNPNFGSTPVTIAAVFLPWPVGVITGILKGIGVSIWTGKVFVEMPAGIGDALMAYFTNRLAKRWKKSYAAVAGQISRYIFTSGMVALFISLAIAMGAISPTGMLIPGLAPSSSFTANLFTTWAAISFPALTLSIIFNASASVLIIHLAGKRIEERLSKDCRMLKIESEK